MSEIINKPSTFCCFTCAKIRNITELTNEALAIELYKDSLHFRVRPGNKLCTTCTGKQARKLQRIQQSQEKNTMPDDTSFSTDNQNSSKSSTQSVVKVPKAGPKSFKVRLEQEKENSQINSQLTNRSRLDSSGMTSDESDWSNGSNTSVFQRPKAGPKSAKLQWQKNSQHETVSETQPPPNFSQSIADESADARRLAQDSFDRMVNREPQFTSTQNSVPLYSQPSQRALSEDMEFDEIRHSQDPPLFSQSSGNREHSSEPLSLNTPAESSGNQIVFSDASSESSFVAQPHQQQESSDITPQTSLTPPPTQSPIGGAQAAFSDMDSDLTNRPINTRSRSRSRSPLSEASVMSTVAPMQVPRIRTQRSRIFRANYTPRVNGG